MKLGQAVAVLFALSARAWAGGFEAGLDVESDGGFVVREGAVLRVEGDVQAAGDLSVEGRLEVYGDLTAPRGRLRDVRFAGGRMHRIEVAPESSPRLQTESFVVRGDEVVAVAPQEDSLRGTTGPGGFRARPAAGVPPATGPPSAPAHFGPHEDDAHPALPASHFLLRFSHLPAGASRGPPGA